MSHQRISYIKGEDPYTGEWGELISIKVNTQLFIFNI